MEELIYYLHVVIINSRLVAVPCQCPAKGPYIYRNVSSANYSLCENPCKPLQKKSSKFTKKITHVDVMMIHNLVWLEICYFYISQTKSSLDKIFYKIVYHLHVWFFNEFRQLFTVICMDFHEIMVCTKYVPDWLVAEQYSRQRSPLAPKY